MKNSVSCPNCSAENPFYNFICSSCKTYLRDRVYNLDLWNLLISIIENPVQAFKTIVFSEHKNFILFIILFLNIKYLINVRFVSMLSMGEFQSTIELPLSYLIILGGTTLFLIIFSLLYVLIGKLNFINLRFRDTLALLIYSQIPLLFGLIILFPLELVLLGDYLFSINPSPFVIKGIIVYIFVTLEIAILIWTIFLNYKAFLAQTNHFIFSLTAVFTFIILSSILIYFCSLFVFTI